MGVFELIQSARTRGYPVVMGVLNVTPDSFFDGGRYTAADATRRQIDRLLDQGTEVIDIGAESSRPGAPQIPAAEQLTRMEVALPYALSRGAVVSVDTTSPQVAEVALAEGAQLINDVSCLQEQGLAAATARHRGWLILMHSRKPMIEMSGFSQWPDDDYADIVDEVMTDWGKARAQATQCGVDPERIIFDPGLGFSKNARHSFAVLRHLAAFKSLGAPMLVGASRKSFLSHVDQAKPGERLGGSLASALYAAEHGADLVRVHDVQETLQALKVWAELRHSQPQSVE